MLTLLSLVALAAPCDLNAPADAAFTETHLEAPQVQVVIELWADGADATWLTETSRALDERELGGAVVARPETLSSGLAQAIEALAPSHELVVRIESTPTLEPSGPGTVDLVGLRSLRRVARRATGRPARAATAALTERLPEAVLGRAGFRTLVAHPAPPSSQPRRSLQFQGQILPGVVLPPGAYRGACGPDPRTGPWTPASADRATRALREAAAEAGTPVVRVSLVGQEGAATDAAVLGRWLDEIVLPSGARVLPPSAVREHFLAVTEGTTEATEAIPGGRIVTRAALLEAAAVLDEVPVVPRALPGELNPTELFLGLVSLASAPSPPQIVRLGAILGPPSAASTTLAGPLELDCEAVRATARALSESLPEHIPAALPVDGQLLTAAEVLLVLGQAARDQACVARPLAVPEPHEAGLGWGVASTP